MQVYSIKRPEKRVETRFNSNLNIQSYGNDNLYPQRMQNLIRNSSTGGTCLERYIAFIEGNGLEDALFAELEVNRKGETMDDIHRKVASDLGTFNGFALHVNYDLTGKIVEVQHIPFESCRLEEENEDGVVPFIVVHPDWEGNKTQKGKKIQVNAKNIKRFYRFNPLRNVVMAQIEKDGGIENYRGQILWVSMDGVNTYPTPIYDKVATNLSTDEGLDNVKYRNVRNNFMPFGMLIHKKGTAYQYDGEGQNANDAELQSALTEFSGDTNACSLMEIVVNQDEDVPTFSPIQGNNFDQTFTATESAITERIYSAFSQEVWMMIRLGKTGFSGSIVAEAYEYYNSFVDRQRRALSRAYAKIFKYWHNGEPTGYAIQPLVYISVEDKTKQE